MKQLIGRLERGYNYFGSGGNNSEQFEEFFKDFKKSFTYQLKRLGATEISFSKGHFYISGFYKVGDQYYYFSISDVRDGVRNFHNPKMLVRTAKSPEDYTGGGNNYVVIEDGMYKTLARKFWIKLPDPKVSKGKDVTQIAQEIAKKGFGEMYVSSMRKANSIAWRVSEVLVGEGERKTMRITVGKYGRSIAYAKASNDDMNYYYDPSRKRLEINIFDKRINEKAFLKTLKLPKNPEYRVNPFTGEQAELEPMGVALYDFIKEAEIRQTPLFQEALLIFREKYPDEYMTLLD